MSFRSTERGFMEPIKHTTYHEDVYTKKNEHDLAEAGTFDLCEDSSDDESNDSNGKHTRKNAQHITSYGSIKKPPCKTPLNIAPSLPPRASYQKDSVQNSPKSQCEAFGQGC